MKTAVSLPDDLFRQAEAAARQLRISRSQFYATAISEFLKRRQSSKVTERLNEVYSHELAKLDPAFGELPFEDEESKDVAGLPGITWRGRASNSGEK